MAVSRLLLFLCLQVSLIFCAPSREDRAVEPPIKQLPPKQDAFYNTVSGFEKQKPGTILSHRRVPGPITLDNKNPILPKNAWQIQYRTQNSVGEPEQTMVTVLEPYNAKPGNLFVYHFFSVSSNRNVSLKDADCRFIGRSFQRVRTQRDL